MSERAEPGKSSLILQAGGWGVVGAMAMSGMRTMTSELGLVGETPPEAVAKQGANTLLKQVPPKLRGAAIELTHWGFGAVGGSLFGVLPRRVRRRGWTGPAYGLLVWLSFELGLAPALGLSQARRLRLSERAAFAADHLLYGLILAKGLESQQPNDHDRVR